MSIIPIEGVRNAFTNVFLAINTLNPKLRNDPRQLMVIGVGFVAGFLLVGALTARQHFDDMLCSKLKKGSRKKRS